MVKKDLPYWENQNLDSEWFGDDDGDGAFNITDCDPNDSTKQGFFKRAAHVVTGGKYGQSAEDYDEEKEEKRKKKLEALAKKTEYVQEKLAKKTEMVEAKTKLKKAKEELRGPSRWGLAKERLQKIRGEPKATVEGGGEAKTSGLGGFTQRLQKMAAMAQQSKTKTKTAPKTMASPSEDMLGFTPSQKSKTRTAGPKFEDMISGGGFGQSPAPKSKKKGKKAKTKSWEAMTGFGGDGGDFFSAPRKKKKGKKRKNKARDFDNELNKAFGF